MGFRTHGGKADLVTSWDIGIRGDLLCDGSGGRQGSEDPKGKSGKKADAEHGELLLEYENSEKDIIEQVRPVKIDV